MKIPCLTLLDHAVDLANQELYALENKAYDDALVICQSRTRVLTAAWEHYEEAAHDSYHARLLTLQKLLGHIEEIASAAHAEVEMSLGQSKKEKQRIRGYHAAISQALA